MALEIERKFLVDASRWADAEKGQPELLSQGYLLTDPEKTIRVRVTGTAGYLTIKGKNEGAVRREYEYGIPKEEAQELLGLFAANSLTKLRYTVVAGGNTWEIDEFLDENAGLIVAEIELADEHQLFDLPDWAGPEVTGDARYYNSSLSLRPFRTWPAG